LILVIFPLQLWLQNPESRSFTLHRNNIAVSDNAIKKTANQQETSRSSYRP
jgi:hypothetical protein